MKNVLAIILGGGKGSRLYPLTKIRAKPAVPLGGKFRLIDIPISNCINSNIMKMHILTQFNTHSLHRHIYDTYRLGQFSGGFVNILSAEQTEENQSWYQGTADAVRQNIQYIKGANTKYSLILSGDHLYRMDYRKFFDFHYKKNAGLTVSVKPVSREEASDFGILQTNKQGQIIRFVEKPEQDKLDDLKSPGLPEATPFLASMGIYFFNTENLLFELEKNTNVDFGKHIIPSIIEKEKVFAYKFEGYWKDIGTIKAFYDSNLEIASIHPPFTFFDENAPFYTHPRYLPGTRVENSQIDHALISDGSYIMDTTVSKAVIGLRTIIRSHSSIQESILMGADYFDIIEKRAEIPIGIGKNCVIKKAIIDKNVRIGDNVQIINKDNKTNYENDMYTICDGIIVIPKGTVIPNGTVI